MFKTKKELREYGDKLHHDHESLPFFPALIEYEDVGRIVVYKPEDMRPLVAFRVIEINYQQKEKTCVDTKKM